MLKTEKRQKSLNQCPNKKVTSYDPPKTDHSTSLRLIRAHLVNWLRFYDSFKISPVFVVLNWPLLVQILD